MDSFINSHPQFTHALLRRRMMYFPRVFIVLYRDRLTYSYTLRTGLDSGCDSRLSLGLLVSPPESGSGLLTLWSWV